MASPPAAPAPTTATAPSSSSSSSSTPNSLSPPPPSLSSAPAAAAAVEPADASQVFLSYQWDLQPIVEDLKDRLQENGISCWMDKTNMGAGDSLRAEIDTGIRNCKVRWIGFLNSK